MAIHMMLDLETLGSGNDAAIVQIGAVKFDPFVPGYTLGQRRWNVSLESSVAHGGIIDASTVLWWLHQSQEARDSVFPVPDVPSLADMVDIPYALIQLRDFYQNAGNYQAVAPVCSALWAHATFDPVVIASAYRNCEIRLPWSFRDVRDLRTLVSLAPKAAAHAYETKGGTYGPKHDALADALVQTSVVWECMMAINPLEEDR